MNRDGSEKQKLLDFDAKVFFLNDNFTFVYQPSTQEYNFIYISDIKNTFTKLLFDLREIGENYTNIYDFNPIKNEILLLIASEPQTPTILATYNLQSKKIDTISIAESGWGYVRPKYSNDYTKIALTEWDRDIIAKIVLLEKDEKKELIRTTNANELIDYNPLAFSPNDRYVAYAKNILLSGNWVGWTSYLYVVDIYKTKSVHRYG